MYNVVASNKFKRDLKLAIKRKFDITLLDEVVSILQKGEKLPEKYHDHPLVGNYAGCRECVASSRLLNEFCLRKTSHILWKIGFWYTRFQMKI